MRIVGYESEEVIEVDEGYDPGTDWLVLRGEVKGSAGTRAYEGISLDVDEVGRLVGWLEAVAAGATGPSDSWNKSAVFFSEPDIAARVTARVGDDVTIRWYFEDAASTEDLSKDLIFSRDFPSYQAASVDILASSPQVEAAAHDLAGVLRALVDRRTQ